MKMVKQTFTPNTTAAPSVKSLSASILIYGILFLIWVTLQLAK